jgi:elongation factor Ts
MENIKMTEINIALVKILRERTGAGMMDCKNALRKSGGDIELSIANMRKSGAIKAAKKASNVAYEGIIKTRITEDYGIIIEINCQTDFVARDKLFSSFAEKALEIAFHDRITNIEKLRARLEEERVALVARLGENIHIRRINSLQGGTLGHYVHSSRIGVIVSVNGRNEELVKHIAMHIAASKPEFIRPKDVPSAIVEKESQVQVDIAIQSGKPKDIAEKIVKGRVRKFISEICLVSQPFIINPSKTIEQVLQENKIDIVSFIRFEVGEGISKTESDFNSEVSQISQSY